jgi:hypothetical protein
VPTDTDPRLSEPPLLDEPSDGTGSDGVVTQVGVEEPDVLDAGVVVVVVVDVVPEDEDALPVEDELPVEDALPVEDELPVEDPEEPDVLVLAGVVVGVVVPSAGSEVPPRSGSAGRPAAVPTLDTVEVRALTAVVRGEVAPPAPPPDPPPEATRPPSAAVRLDSAADRPLAGSELEPELEPEVRPRVLTPPEPSPDPSPGVGDGMETPLAGMEPCETNVDDPPPCVVVPLIDDEPCHPLVETPSSCFVLAVEPSAPDCDECRDWAETGDTPNSPPSPPNSAPTPAQARPPEATITKVLLRAAPAIERGAAWAGGAAWAA